LKHRRRERLQTLHLLHIVSNFDI